MKTFDKIIEIKENTPGTWYARFTHVDGGTVQSEFLKFKQKSAPTPAQVRDRALLLISHLNSVGDIVPIIPELAPVVPGLNAGQQVTLNLIWTFLKIWLRQLIGRQ